MLKKVAALSLIAALAGGAAHAGTASVLSSQNGTTNTTLTVTANVQTNCTVATTNTLAFGAINVTNNAVGATGTITVNCTNGTDYAIGLDNGGHYDATASMRNMAAGNTIVNGVLTANKLPYMLCADNSLTCANPIGNIAAGGATGSAAAFGGTGVALGTQSLNVYAVIPAGSYQPGSYTDTVTVTVGY